MYAYSREIYRPKCSYERILILHCPCMIDNEKKFSGSKHMLNLWCGESIVGQLICLHAQYVSQKLLANM